MIKRVYKYTLAAGVQIVKMPEGAQILTTQIQHGRIRVWALADYSKRPEPRLIAVMPTGVPVPENIEYIGTIQLDGGALVYHIFECMADIEIRPEDLKA